MGCSVGEALHSPVAKPINEKESARLDWGDYWCIEISNDRINGFIIKFGWPVFFHTPTLLLLKKAL